MIKPVHIVVLVFVILLVFGAKKLPEIAGSVGKSMKVFKKEVKELREDDMPEQQVQAAQLQPGRSGQPTSQPPQYGSHSSTQQPHAPQQGGQFQEGQYHNGQYALQPEQVLADPAQHNVPGYAQPGQQSYPQPHHAQRSYPQPDHPQQGGVPGDVPRS